MTAAVLGRAACRAMRASLWCVRRPGHPGRHIDCLGREWE